MTEILNQPGAGPYCGECGMPVCEHMLGLDVLRDKYALRAGLGRLDNRELGVVLGLALHQLDDRGDSPLPNLLRVLADQVDDLIAEMGE